MRNEIGDLQCKNTKKTMENKKRGFDHSSEFQVPCKIARTMKDTFFFNIDSQRRKIQEITEPKTPSTKIQDLESNRMADSIGSKSSGPIKRVSFDDLATDIVVYKIHPGNTLKKCPSKDAPLLMKKSRKRSYTDRRRSCPRLEQFLLNIFRWNPNWLEDQEQLNRLPLATKGRRLRHTSLTYETYGQYYNVMEPLLILELWHSLKRDFDIGQKNAKNSPMMSSIVENSIHLTTVESTKISVTTLMLEAVVSKRDIHLQSHPVCGDLVSFECVSNDAGKFSSSKVFAYVTSIRETMITPLTRFNRDLINFVEDPQVVLTFTTMTKPLDQTCVQTNRIVKLQRISYLSSNIRMIKGLQYLFVSPLLNQILHPNIDDYQLPFVENHRSYPLVTKDKLSPEQLETVVKITDTVVHQIPKICLVEGPPGTGKSKVIVNLVIEILYGNGRYQHEQPLRILVCSSSNAAIDEIVLRLLEVRKITKLKIESATRKIDMLDIDHAKARIVSECDRPNRFKMVRSGENASMHPVVKKVALTELAKAAVKRTTARYLSRVTEDSIEDEKRVLQARINALELELLSAQNASLLYPKRIIRKLNDVKAKLDLLMSRQSKEGLDSVELSSLQKATEESLLAGADVIACTLDSCYSHQMESVFAENDEAISVCIIDEATRCTEAETLVPLMLGVRTLVLVGDSEQTPFSIKSQSAGQFGLDKSLFSRIKKLFKGQGENPIIRLYKQYRMSYPISLWPNRYFCSGAMKNAANLQGLPFSFYKVIDIDFMDGNAKFSSMKEATFVANLVYTMMNGSNVKNANLPLKMGIITTCESEKALIMKKIQERIESLPRSVRKRIINEVDTIDGFQGRERDIVIVACTSSGHSGFLTDRQSLYSAVTRAKHSLILCGDFTPFSKDPMCNSLLKDARSRQVYVKMKATASPEDIKPYVVR